MPSVLALLSSFKKTRKIGRVGEGRREGRTAGRKKEGRREGREEMGKHILR